MGLPAVHVRGAAGAAGAVPRGGAGGCAGGHGGGVHDGTARGGVRHRLHRLVRDPDRGRRDGAGGPEARGREGGVLPARHGPEQDHRDGDGRDQAGAAAGGGGGGAAAGRGARGVQGLRARLLRGSDGGRRGRRRPRPLRHGGGGPGGAKAAVLPVLCGRSGRQRQRPTASLPRRRTRSRSCCRTTRWEESSAKRARL